MWIKRNLLLLAATIFLFSCTKSPNPGTPQRTLADYVALSFSIKSFTEKEKLEKLSSGAVHESLEKMNEEQFKEQFASSDRTFVALKIKDERKLGEDRYSITYEITYRSNAAPQSGSDPVAADGFQGTVTNKKHAVFTKKDDQWLISEVQNLKTFIESKNEMNL